MQVNCLSQLSKAVIGGTRGDLGPYTHSKPETAPSTPTSEETEPSSCPAGQASGSTQTEENESAQITAPVEALEVAAVVVVAAAAVAAASNPAFASV